MIAAVDTNILIYAHRAECAEHRKARRLLSRLAEADIPWALAWPCVYEFLRVVTHPKVFHPVTSLAVAWQNIYALLQSPSLLTLTETERHAPILAGILADTAISGNILHDAHIVALMIEHGVREIYTADADFGRFSGIKATNPFK